MEIAEHSALLLEDAATAIPPTIVVSQDHCQGEGKLRDPACQAQIPIGEITNKKNSVRHETLQQLLIRIAPSAMQITSNGKSQVLQSECLGCGHPAPNRS